jgi:hypothetical protein
VDNPQVGRLDPRPKDSLEIEGKSQAMAVLELVRHEPNWNAALEVAFALPSDGSERRAGEPEAEPPEPEQPRRISDELLWLRHAIDEPETSGLTPLPDSAAVGMWDAEDACLRRLCRLRDRQVLQAAGFLLHESDDADLV